MSPIIIIPEEKETITLKTEDLKNIYRMLIVADTAHYWMHQQ